MATLAVKVSEAVHNEYGPVMGEAVIGEIPQEAMGGVQEDHTPSPALFAFYFGAAYVLARVEEPWASEQDWCDTAREAATKVYRWEFSQGGRPDGEE